MRGVLVRESDPPLKLILQKRPEHPRGDLVILYRRCTQKDLSALTAEATRLAKRQSGKRRPPKELVGEILNDLVLRRFTVGGQGFAEIVGVDEQGEPRYQGVEFTADDVTALETADSLELLRAINPRLGEPTKDDDEDEEDDDELG